MEFEFLEELLKTQSVSGCEESAQSKVFRYLDYHADMVRTDPVGNVIAGLNTEADFAVLMTAHMDEIGFRVTSVNEQGFVRIQAAGGVRPRLYVGQPMTIRHVLKDEEETEVFVSAVSVVSDDLLNKDVKAKDLVLDIGANDKEEALKMISVGDAVTAVNHVQQLLNHRISSRALDDKAGVAVISEAFRLVQEAGTQNGIYAVSASGEETGGRGAYFAGSVLKPNCAIAVDVTWASDTIGTDSGLTGEVCLGKGPVLCHSGMVNTKMNELLEQIAKEKEIPIQYEVAAGRTFTDGDTLLKTADGIPMALVSIPLRYMHSSVEVADTRDLENAALLLAEFLIRINENFDFCPNIQ